MKTTQDRIKIAVAAVSLGLVVLIVLAIVFIPTLQENKLAIHILGIIEGAWMVLLNYYFGSSKSSQDKTDLMNQNNKDENSTAS